MTTPPSPTVMEINEPMGFTEIDIDDHYEGGRASPSPPRSRVGTCAMAAVETKILPPVIMPKHEEADSSHAPATLRSHGGTAGGGAQAAAERPGQKVFYTVSDPVLQDAKLMDKHYDYLVEVKAQDGSVTASCRRRYNHFEWLRNKLCQSRPDLIIPPLPGKTLIAVGGDKLEVRRAGLERFLTRVACHRELSASRDLETFVLGDAGSLSSKGSGLNIFDAIRTIRTCPRKYIEAMEAAQRVERTLTVLDRHNQRLSKLRYDMAEDSSQLCLALQRLERLTPQIATTIHDVRHAVEHDNEVERKAVVAEVTDVENSIRELGAYAQAVVAMLNHRASVQRNLESIGAQQEKTNMELDALESGQNKLLLGQLMGKDINQLKEEKICALNTKLDELSEQRVNAEKELGRVNETVDRELEWWDGFRQIELRKAFQKHIQQTLLAVKSKKRAYAKAISQGRQ